MESFLEQGNNLLQLQATSVEEIGRAGQEAKGLVEQLPVVTQVKAHVCNLAFLPALLTASGSW